MARKDDILYSFLKHEILVKKYDLKESEIPAIVRQALSSDVPIVKAIALIVDGLENLTPITDSVLRNQITQFLNEAI